MNNHLEHIVRTTLKDVLSEQSEKTSPGVFDDAQKKFLGSFAAYNSQQLGIIYSVSDIGIREFIARSGPLYNCTPAVLLSLVRGKYIKIIPYTGAGRNKDYTIELQLPLADVKQFAVLAAGEKSDGAAAGGDTSSPSSGGGGSFGGGGGGGLPPMDDIGGEDVPPADGDVPPVDGDVPPVDGEPLPDEPPTEEEPGPELAHVVKYGDLLNESSIIAKRLMSEASKTKKKVRQ
jgi:hypothetical protein